MMYDRIVEIIKSYTGLSPTSFLVILTLFIITYIFVSSFFVHVDVDVHVSNSTHVESQHLEPVQLVPDIKRVPLQLGPITPDQLKSYDGSDPNKPLLMAIKGQIYDVSLGSMFYGPGGPYSLFAGRDATRALALMSFDPQDLTSNIHGLTDADLDVLNDWELKFSEKYPKVGTLLVDADPTQTQPQPQPKPKPDDGGSTPAKEEEDTQHLESKKFV